MSFLPDKPIIIRSNVFTKAVSWFLDVYAITLYPFVVMRESEEKEGMSVGDRFKAQLKDQTIIHHETIHMRQYKELWVIGLVFVYLYDWIHGVIKYKSFQKAYYRIRVEQEAYSNQNKFQFYFDGKPHGELYEKDYADTREPFAWKKYEV